MSITLGTHSSQKILKRAQVLREAQESVGFKGFSGLQTNIYKFMIVFLKKAETLLSF